MSGPYQRLAVSGFVAVLGVVALAAAAWAARDEPITPIPLLPAVDLRKVALGAMLFRDPRLSANGRISCQSCHDVGSNGATGRSFDVGADGHPFDLNTPTVFNAALSFRLNWEGNLRSLDELVVVSLHNPKLMGAGGPVVMARLQADRGLAERFRMIYGRGVDEMGIADAMSEYMRTLVTPRSRFDRWLEGDTQALTSRELRGYGLFKTLGCVSCHQGVNVGGNLFQRHGIFHPLAAPLPTMLRVPSLRNVAETAPYFHDGSAKTLGDAVRSMGRAQLDVSLPEGDVEDIVAFLSSLTGEYDGQPVTPARTQ